MTYNQASFVRDAVSSALQQECEPLEILISDDASTDTTFDVIQTVTKEYRGPHRITLNRNARNLGLIGHLNKCIELSKAELFIGAAGDDISLPNRAEKILNSLRENRGLLAHSRVQPINEVGEDVPNPPHLDKPTFFKPYSLDDVAISPSLYIGATVGWHRDLFVKYGSINFPNAYEDLILGFRAALEGRVEFIDEPLLRYRVSTGISSPQREWKAYHRICFLERQADVLCQRGLDAETARNLRIQSVIQRELECIRCQLNIYRSKASFALALITQPAIARKAWLRETTEWQYR